VHLIFLKKKNVAYQVRASLIPTTVGLKILSYRLKLRIAGEEGMVIEILMIAFEKSEENTGINEYQHRRKDPSC
jgi:hypothetical protein